MTKAYRDAYYQRMKLKPGYAAMMREKNRIFRERAAAGVKKAAKFQLRAVVAWLKPDDAEGPYMLLAGYPRDWEMT